MCVIDFYEEPTDRDTQQTHTFSILKNMSSHSKRRRTDEDSTDEDSGDVDSGTVRLSEGLRAMMGGNKYCKEGELTRSLMLSYLKAKGEIKQVTLFRVNIETMGGTSFSVPLAEDRNRVKDLRNAIEDQEGTAGWSQQLFLLGKRVEGDNENQMPLDDAEVIEGECSVALCVDTTTLRWDNSSPLMSTKQFELSEGDRRATMIGDGPNKFLTESGVLETGTHTISCKLMVGEGDARAMYMLCGLVRDGRDDPQFPHRDSTDAWMMSSGGYLYGNGKPSTNEGGEILHGQVLTMEANVDTGTLHFWVDGKPHGPGWTRGVTGRLRWAAGVFGQHTAVQIVPTPELQR